MPAVPAVSPGDGPGDGIAATAGLYGLLVVGTDGGWRCHDCRVRGRGGAEGAEEHVRTEHAGEPYLDRCGWCPSQVAFGTSYCCAEHQQLDRASIPQTG